jgi:hypothetical protein
MERDTHLQDIFTYLLIYLFIPKALGKERPSMFPKSGLLWKQMPIPEPYLTYFSGSPAKEPSLQVPLMESPQREMKAHSLDHFWTSLLMDSNTLS